MMEIINKPLDEDNPLHPAQIQQSAYQVWAILKLLSMQQQFAEHVDEAERNEQTTALPFVYQILINLSEHIIQRLDELDTFHQIYHKKAP